MSYFDHVRCSACKSILDPENLATVQGQGMSCPYCKAPLSLKDLFGLADAFAEEESPDLSLDALVDGFEDPPIPSVAPPQRKARRAPAPSAPSAHPARRALGARSDSTAMVPTSRREDDGDAGSSAPSALELMRAMRKKR